MKSKASSLKRSTKLRNLQPERSGGKNSKNSQSQRNLLIFALFKNALLLMSIKNSKNI